MHQKSQEYRVGPGASSLLLIFVAMSLTTVAILALVSAVSDSNLTRRSQQTISAYYTAAELVQIELADIDARLAAAREAGDEGAYAEAVYALTGEEIKLSVEPGPDERYALLSFSEPMYGGHEIFVQLHVPLSLTGARYTVAQHMVQDTTAWTPDDGMNLFSQDDLSDD